MILMALFMFFPIYWIFVNSLKTITGISAWPPEFFPKDPQWGNYVKVLQNPNTLLYLRNTLVLVVLNTVGTLLTSSVVVSAGSYELQGTRHGVRHHSGDHDGAVCGACHSAVPAVPQLRHADSFLASDPAELLRTTIQRVPVRQFFVSIPDSIDEAAMLDGCNRWQAFWKVIVPLGKPFFITVGIMSASFWWNELFSPLVYINSEELKPLTLGVLTSFVETSAGTSKTMWNLQVSLLHADDHFLLHCCASAARSTSPRASRPAV